jgi:dihydrofolate reductase
MELCKNDDKVFFMGGAMVYRQAMEYVNTLYITWIHHEFEADVFFPEIDLNIWQEVEREDHLDAEPYAFSYVRYVRK